MSEKRVIDWLNKNGFIKTDSIEAQCYTKKHKNYDIWCYVTISEVQFCYISPLHFDQLINNTYEIEHLNVRQLDIAFAKSKYEISCSLC